MITKPNYNEAPNYYHHFFNLVPSEDLMAELHSSMDMTKTFIQSIPAEKADYKYAEGKWTVKQVLRHIIDTERIFVYRAFRFSRFDTTPLAGFDEDAYIDAIQTIDYSLNDLLEEFVSVRQTTIQVYKTMTPTMLDFKGTANNIPITPRCIGYMAVGHNLHHCNVIRERYL